MPDQPSRPRTLRVHASFGRALALAAFVTVTGAASIAAPRTQASTGNDYTILIYERESELAARTSPAAGDAYWSAYDAFAGELAKAGVLRGGSALDESVRSTVRGHGTADNAVRGARLGGYFVIAAPDRATAEAWARKAPPRAVAVEVRPHRANPHMAAMPGAPRP